MKNVIAVSASVFLLGFSLSASANNTVLQSTPSGQKYLNQCQDTQPTGYQAKVCERLLSEARQQSLMGAAANPSNGEKAGSFAKNDLPQMSKVDTLRRAEQKSTRQP